MDGCSCHLNAPCSFCTSLTEEESEVFWSDGMIGLEKYRNKHMSATCQFCNQKMDKGNGCTLSFYDDFSDKVKRDRVPFEGDHGEVCHDCNVNVGQFHHPGCDDERCPKCHGQALSCGCAAEDD